MCWAREARIWGACTESVCCGQSCSGAGYTDDGAASCSALLDILAAAGDSDKATNAYRQQLFSVVLRALDIRRSAPMGASEESLDVVEGKAVDACVEAGFEMLIFSFGGGFDL